MAGCWREKGDRFKRVERRNRRWEEPERGELRRDCGWGIFQTTGGTYIRNQDGNRLSLSAPSTVYLHIFIYFSKSRRVKRDKWEKNIFKSKNKNNKLVSELVSQEHILTLFFGSAYIMVVLYDFFYFFILI